MINRNRSLILQLFTNVILILICMPSHTWAEWKVISHLDNSSETKTDIAYISNDAGFSLEIYRDSVDAIRSRISITEGLISFANKICPTYQVDRGISQNRSTNDAPCISGPNWAEFILGQIEGNRIKSSTLFALMNGSTVTFRFRLSNGDYREIKFSLLGSNRAMTAAFGKEIIIDTSL